MAISQMRHRISAGSLMNWGNAISWVAYGTEVSDLALISLVLSEITSNVPSQIVIYMERHKRDNGEER